MTSVVAFTLLLVGGQGPAPVVPTVQKQASSLLQEIIPRPTGRNGYEEYLMACDIVRDSKVAQFVSGNPSQFQETIRAYESPVDPRDERPSESDYNFAKKYRNYTLLQLRREAMAKAGRALDLLRKGNEKQIHDPRLVKNWDTPFPEYAHMRALGRLAVAGCYVAYADGQPRRGTQYLLDSMQMGQEISRSVLISRLVGISIQAIVLAEIEKLLPMINAADAKLLQQAARSWITDPPAAVETLEHEFAFMSRTMDTLFDRVDAGGDFTEILSDEVRAKSVDELVKRLTQQDKQRIIQIIKNRLEQHKRQLIASYQRPEAHWDESIEFAGTSVTREGPIRSVEELAEVLADAMTPVFSQFGAAELKTRTQFRLLGLAAAVIQYRWEHDRLPMRLEDVLPEQALKDPASGENFFYEIMGNGFRVYSKGTPRSGEIGMKYVRPQKVDPNIPPQN